MVKLVETSKVLEDWRIKKKKKVHIWYSTSYDLKKLKTDSSTKFVGTATTVQLSPNTKSGGMAGKAGTQLVFFDEETKLQS